MDDDDTRTTWIDQTQEKKHTHIHTILQCLSKAVALLQHRSFLFVMFEIYFCNPTDH